MKIVITENKRIKVVTKWLDDNYGDLNPIIDNNPIYITFTDNNGDDILLYNSNSKGMVIINDVLQDSLKEMFGVKYNQLDDIFIPWIRNTYGKEVKFVMYQTWHCNTCGKFHPTKYHIDDDTPHFS